MKLGNLTCYMLISYVFVNELSKTFILTLPGTDSIILVDIDTLLKGQNMHIPLAPPNLSDLLQAYGPTWASRMGDPDVVDFVRRSNDGYIHWNKMYATTEEICRRTSTPSWGGWQSP